MRATKLFLGASAAGLASLLSLSSGQAQTYKTDIRPAITIPDSVETRLGTLKFKEGFPDDATVQKVYDNLDFQRGVQAFLTAMPAASLAASRKAFRSFGLDNQTVLIFENLMDSRTLFLTANTESIYAVAWLDLKDGPVVVESPPNTLGLVDDFWFHYVTDLGNAGPDKGKGGKFLFLPLDYDGAVPEGYHVFKSGTFGNIFATRGFQVDGHPKPGVDGIKQGLRIYPLAQAGIPPQRISSTCRARLSTRSTRWTSLILKRSIRSCRRSRRAPSIPKRSACLHRLA